MRRSRWIWSALAAALALGAAAIAQPNSVSLAGNLVTQHGPSLAGNSVGPQGCVSKPGIPCTHGTATIGSVQTYTPPIYPACQSAPVCTSGTPICLQRALCKSGGGHGGGSGATYACVQWACDHR